MNTSYNKVCWLVDEIIQERGYTTGFPVISDAARSLGCQVYETKYIPFSDTPDSNIPFPVNSCVITHGTVEFNKQIIKFHGKDWFPGAYFNKNVKSYVAFANPLAEYMLNDDYYILPYGEFVRRYVGDPNRKPLFIKPESGLKEFTGQVITPENYKDEFNSMNQIQRVNDDSLCVISSAKDILAEFRYVIVNKKVITGSEYRWDNILDVRVDTHPICDELAEKIASHDWQPDSVYVCDIALVGNKSYKYAKVVELNAFSSSGIYACDTNKIVKAVSDAAWKEYIGDIE